MVKTINALDARKKLGRLLEDGARHAIHAGQAPRARRLQCRGSDPGGDRLSRDREYPGGLPRRLAGITFPRTGHSPSGRLGISSL